MSIIGGWAVNGVIVGVAFVEIGSSEAIGRTRLRVVHCFLLVVFHDRKLFVKLSVSIVTTTDYTNYVKRRASIGCSGSCSLGSWWRSKSQQEKYAIICAPGVCLRRTL